MRITAPPYKEDPKLHLFSGALAGQDYGPMRAGRFDIQGALLLTDIARGIEYWNQKRTRGRGRAHETQKGWFYISIDDLAKRHPYLTKRTVRRIMDRLRKEGILKTTQELHKRKSEHTLWYGFVDKEVYRAALAREDAISFWVQDAVDCGIEAAILYRNFQYSHEEGLTRVEPGGGGFRINPVAFLDDTNLPMSPQAVRRALRVLVKENRLERKRKGKYGESYYLYNLVDNHHLQSYEERDALPTEAHEPELLDDLPTEHYEELPPMTAHREHKDKEDAMMKESAEYLERVRKTPRRGKQKG